MLKFYHRVNCAEKLDQAKSILPFFGPIPLGVLPEPAKKVKECNCENFRLSHFVWASKVFQWS